ncbi:uncharacterized protein UV8b_02397 [Ustilaginoidea virens]|uniref:Uncharacterized protein n=1 Tax=Ustilaginoidea virens TaxID=1159556 RepID=A0A8E5MG27_USTVR|nr:uncharacterized protein UV8b_02397 [Ustilaginoidea virens]QUC18156.1 hypothetical protein UV8b_02397 [Ustilaginoidea virens]
MPMSIMCDATRNRHQVMGPIETYCITAICPLTQRKRARSHPNKNWAINLDSRGKNSANSWIICLADRKCQSEMLLF